MIRVPLEKNEIAQENNFSKPIELINGRGETMTYDKTDPNRWFAPEPHLESDGSFSWKTIKIEGGKTVDVLINRKALSDEFLNIASSFLPEKSP